MQKIIKLISDQAIEVKIGMTGGVGATGILTGLELSAGKLLNAIIIAIIGTFISFYTTRLLKRFHKENPETDEDVSL